MADIINLDKERGAREPHLSGRAICLQCRYAWVAVVPVGRDAFDCPECGLEKGVMQGLVQPQEGEPIWQCHCGCEMFYIPASGFPTCVMCGTEQSGYLDAP